MGTNQENNVAKSLHSFDTFAEKMLKDFGCAGAAVAVIKDDKVILSKGYGYRNIETKEPVDSDTLFAIGSASKAFTAMDLGMLVDQGKLDWDKPVRGYMPDFGLSDAYASEHTTTRDLLSHRTGFPAHELVWYNSLLSRSDLLHRLPYLELHHSFRSEFQYANLMFLAAGCLVEKISESTWEEFTREQIFTPLGMTRSNFSVKESMKEPNAALPYSTENNQPKEIPFRDLDAIGPAGSINSCLNDMVKWVMMHLNHGSFDSNQIISEKNLTQILKPVIPIPPTFNYEYFNYSGLGGMNYGMAWFINEFRGKKLIQHGGSIDGFLACISFMPEENLGVICLTNQSNSLIPYLFAYTLYDRLLDLPLIAWDERMMGTKRKIDAEIAANETRKKQSVVKNLSTPTHPLEDYVGDYWNDGYGFFKVYVENGSLRGKYNLYEFALESSRYDSFTAKMISDFPVVFASNFEGEIISLSIPLEPDVNNIIFTRQQSEFLSSAEILNVYCGKYQMIDGSQIIIRMTNGSMLSAIVPNLPEMGLVPVSIHKFKVENFPAIKLEFHTDITGNVQEFDLLQPGNTTTVKKLVD